MKFILVPTLHVAEGLGLVHILAKPETVPTISVHVALFSTTVVAYIRVSLVAPPFSVKEIFLFTVNVEFTTKKG